MNILAVDTSLDFCICAISVNGRIDDIAIATQYAHADLILENLTQLLVRNRLNLTDLTALGYVAGPARFTGIRIACSVCQALSFAKNIPVIQIPSLQFIAQSMIDQIDQTPMVVAMDAFMNEVYWGVYRKVNQLMQPVVPDSLLMPETAIIPPNCTLGVGDAWEKYADLARPERIYPLKLRADQLIALAQYYFAQHELLNARSVLPIYLRGKEAWK